MTKNNKNVMKLTDKELADQFSVPLALETIRLLKYQGKDKSDLHNRNLIIGFLTTYVHTLVYAHLSTDASHLETNKDKYAFIKKKFELIKNDMQESISEAFTRAVKSWSGVEMEYYTIIKPVPDPKPGSNGKEIMH